MAKYVGSWWIKDGIHGESDVKESDFVTTANTTQRSDQHSRG